MPRRPSLAAVSRLADAALKIAGSLERRSEERVIVDRYLHSVRRATRLAGQSKVNARRGWSGASDRQKTRSEAYADTAALLLPLVEHIISHSEKCSPAGALSDNAVIEALTESPSETSRRLKKEKAAMGALEGSNEG